MVEAVTPHIWGVNLDLVKSTVPGKPPKLVLDFSCSEPSEGTWICACQYFCSFWTTQVFFFQPRQPSIFPNHRHWDVKMEAEDGLWRLLVSETGANISRWEKCNSAAPVTQEDRSEAWGHTPRVLIPCPLWFRQAKHTQTPRHAAPKACNKLRGWSVCRLPSALMAAYIRSNENTFEVVKWQDDSRLVTSKENKWNRHHGYSCWNWQENLFPPSTSEKGSLVFFNWECSEAEMSLQKYENTSQMYLSEYIL